MWDFLLHSWTNFGAHHLSGVVLGFFGFGALFALLAFVPYIGPLFSAALSVFNALLETRLGCACMAALLAFALGDTYGRELIQARWHAADLVWVHEAEQRDKDIQKDADNDVDARVAELEKQNKELTDKVTGYEEELQKRPNAGACRLSDDDVRWLRQFGSPAGTPQPASKRPHVVRAPRPASKVPTHQQGGRRPQAVGADAAGAPSR